ncbi:MAG: hypothetical protein HS052_03220 [Thaumarchaeota archaeon]|nr:hypothetical protein [Nitrososphaerota archaeon]
MMESRNNQIAIAVALILLLGTVVVYFSLGPSVTVDVLPSGENELISLAQESGRLNIFVDDEIYDESFFNYIDNEFSTKYGIDVEITTGHWSGIQTSLINEKVSGRNSGSFDLVILNDEATARLIEKKLTFSQTGSIISDISTSPVTDEVLKSKIAGVDNDGSGITLWFDVYSYMYNSEEFYKFENVYCYLGLVGEDDDDDDDDGSGSGDDDDDEDRCPTAEDHDDDDDNNGSGSGDDDDDDDDEVEGVFFPSPVDDKAGAALVVNTVLHYGSSGYYESFYDSSLESEWPELLNFEIEDEPEMEGMDELFGEIEPELDMSSILEVFDDEEVLVGYFRYGSILLESIQGEISDEIEVYFGIEGSVKTSVHATIPFNSPNKAAATLMINEILGENSQRQIATIYGSYPSANAEMIDDVFGNAQFFIPFDDFSDSLSEWPYYSYPINILDMWRVLFEG